MKKEQFTPGPWRVRLYEHHIGRNYSIRRTHKVENKSGLQVICTVTSGVYSQGNLDLIAAAPELYDKLKEAAYEFCHNCLSLRLDREEDIPMSDELIEKNCPLADNGCFCRAWWALLKKAKGGAK